MTPELKRFYVELQRWIDAGCRNDHEFFRPSRSVCLNLYRYCIPCEINFYSLKTEMISQFRDAGLHHRYPFNEGSYDFFTNETHRYKNRRRLQWVKEHAK